MAMPQQKVEEMTQVEMSPDFDKLFDGDLAAVDASQRRRQMTVGECERLLDSGAIGSVRS
ncbi:hypothetical protein [Paenibacillus dendritiformis]|uniref:hypothetical protein n=1 Tax=Paenibacillus dendritiformis TaxID=130049 RepID=UPI000DA8A185|nr:hypothetical protein [Paenibacillus dendritiformis]PZM64839.1 hypothetical protein DOE73_14870 [Paenibacillus dendritiformis]